MTTTTSSFYSRIRSEGLLCGAERDLSAIATFRVLHLFNAIFNGFLTKTVLCLFETTHGI